MTNLLIYRWLLANAAIAALLSIPAMRGDITRLLNEDSSYLSHAILALFAVAWVWNAREIFRMSARRNGLARVRREYRHANPGEDGKAMLQYEWSWERRPPQFHPLPQPPALPPKAEPPSAPHLEL